MKLLLFIFNLLLGLTTVYGQGMIKYAKNQSLEKSNKSLPVLHIIDYTLRDIDSGVKLHINSKGQYQYSDSSIVNAIVYLYLTKGDDNSSVYGWLNGKIINGKREDTWIKKVYIKKKKTALVKEMHYNNGLLNGKYYVYNIKGEILRRNFYPGKTPPCLMFFIDGNCVSEEEYINVKNKTKEPTCFFKNGTGLYLDYYYDSGTIKERGKLQNGIKQFHWYIYDKKGEIVNVETYYNGKSIIY